MLNIRWNSTLGQTIRGIRFSLFEAARQGVISDALAKLLKVSALL